MFCSSNLTVPAFIPPSCLLSTLLFHSGLKNLQTSVDSKVLMCNWCVCVFFFFYPCVKGFKPDMNLTKSHYSSSCRFILPFLYFCPPFFVFWSFLPSLFPPPWNRRKPQALLPHVWLSNRSGVGGRLAARLTPSRCGTRCAQLTTVKRELPLLLSSPAVCIFGMF